MSPEAHGLLLPVSQSFVAAANQSTPSNPIPETRRSTHALGGAGEGGLITLADFAQRWGMPAMRVTPTRYRFKIRNSNVLANTTQAGVLNGTGIWIGVPNTGAEAAWLGDFNGAPKQVVGAFTVDPGATGAEYVSPWITNGGEIAADVQYGISLGITTAVQVNQAAFPIALQWAASGAAATAGNAAVPTGTLSLQEVALDCRIEFEYIARNQIGLFIGTSLSAGGLSTISSPQGMMGPGITIPLLAGAKMSHCNINGGVGGSSTSTWLNTGHLCYSRFDLATCVPDYAVIELGANDAGAAVSLATFQANMQTIIANVLGLGIKRIYLITTGTGTNFSFFGTAIAWQGGILKTALAAGLIATVVIDAGTATPNNGIYPLGIGMPGPANVWYQASGGPWQYFLDLPSSASVFEGPFTITNAVLGAAALTLTSAVTIANAHPVGTPVLTLAEGLRRQYNQWMRQGVPNVEGVVDMATRAEWQTSYPPVIGHPDYYGNVGFIHPTNPGLYQAVASELAAALAGV